MANYLYSSDDDQDDDLTPEVPQPSAPAPAYNLPKAPPIPNPVIQSYQTPGEAAAPTTPQPSFPASPRPQPAAPVAPAPAAAQQPPAVQQPAPAQSGTADDTSVESLTKMLGSAGGDSAEDAAQEARQQELRNQAATNKYQRSQGAQMVTTANGQTQAATDVQGNVLYQPKVLHPVVRDEDGAAYRVTQDQSGARQYFDLNADGKEGADYKTDPHTGERYLDLNHPDGTSRREVIGQDQWIPKINKLDTQRQQHLSDRDDAQQAIQANTYGVAGADGLGSLSLEQLHSQAAALAPGIRTAQSQFDTLEEFRKGGGTLSGQLSEAYRSAEATLNQNKPQHEALQADIAARENDIAQAHQQMGQSQESARKAAQARDVLRVARRGQPELQVALATVANGGALPVAQAGAYTNAGLLVEDKQDDGSTILRVSQEATGLLDPQTRKQIASNPTAFVVRDDRTPEAGKLVKAVAKALPQQNDSAQDDGGDPDATPAQRLWDTLSTRQAAGETLTPAEQNRLTNTARQSWADSQQAILDEYPGVGVAGSPQNVAFVQAFRQSGGDHRGALRLARGLFQRAEK